MLFNKPLANTTAKNFAWAVLGSLAFAGLALLPGVKAQALPTAAHLARVHSVPISNFAAPAKDTFTLGEEAKSHTCGGKNNDIKTSIDFGCQAKGNAILDLLFAFIRFLSYGAGLAIIGSLIYAGIHYSAARGDPQAVGLAKTRIQNVIIALFLFIFTYAILNFLIPEQLLK